MAREIFNVEGLDKSVPVLEAIDLLVLRKLAQGADPLAGRTASSEAPLRKRAPSPGIGGPFAVTLTRYTRQRSYGYSSLQLHPHEY